MRVQLKRSEWTVGRGVEGDGSIHWEVNVSFFLLVAAGVQLRE